MQNTNNKDIKIAVYKWIKIIQSLLLIVLGFTLILISAIRINKEMTTSVESISYCVGVAFFTYGIINMVSGYLLEHSPNNREVLMGIAFSSLGICFIVNPVIITNIFPILIISCAYLFSIMLIIYGVEKIIGKQVKKNIPMSVLIFICAAALIALASLYIFYYKDTSVMNYALAALGFLLAVLGISSIVLVLIKIKNTKEVEKEEEIKRMHEAELARENQDVETKIIDISELRKRNGKKVYTREIALPKEDNENNEDAKDNEVKEEQPDIQFIEDSKPSKRKKKNQ
ncbi:MAG: DMT family transporter [Bacilli bacterium]|nr:DMT family transporter [Bacilli bacterium]MDD7180967.1 DMT family transporter [Bacilli bacterium]